MKVSSRDSADGGSIEFHLKRYHEKHQAYLRAAKRSVAHHTGAQTTLFANVNNRPTLRPFTSKLGPEDPHGYRDNSITGDLVTDIYKEFAETCRQPESEAYLRTLPGASNYTLYFGIVSHLLHDAYYCCS